MKKQQNNSNILVIGATGFTGSRVLHELAKMKPSLASLQVTCMVRKGSTPPDAPDGIILTIVRGDLNNSDDLEKALAGKDGLIYVASLGFSHAEAVVKACEKSNIKRAVFTSTTALFTKLNAPSKKVRISAEKTIMQSKLNWSIIRPTMICGRKGDRNMERLFKYLKYIPILFVPGGGNSLQQPIFVDDVAKALVQCYFSDKASCKAYNISGREPLSFKTIVQTMSTAMGKKRWVVPLPLYPMRLILRFYEKIAPNPRLKEEQLLRLNEDKNFNHDEATADFNFNPVDFKHIANNLVNEITSH